MEKVLRLCCFSYLYGITGQGQMQYVCGRMSRAALYKEPGSRLPAAASCLGRHAHPAGRSPNSSSLFLPLAAVVAVAQGLFPRRTVRRVDAVRIHPCSPFCKTDKTETPVPGSDTGVLGGRGWIARAALLKTAHWAVFALSSATAPQLFESTRSMSLALSQNKNLSALAYVEAFWWARVDSNHRS